MQDAISPTACSATLNKALVRAATIRERNTCRVCGSGRLFSFLSLGLHPKPNGFLSHSEISLEEPRYPLEVLTCENCTLMQLKHVVNPTEMFSHYHYVPSTSATMRLHFEELASHVAARHPLKAELVVDIGSNDGTLLKFFRNHGAIPLGIDPAKNLAALAAAESIPTIADFFTTEIAQKVASQYGRAKVITATNVLGHVDDVDEFCCAVKCLLKEDGILVVEVPHLVSLLNHNQFDTIYHEHLSYFSVQALLHLFANHGLGVASVKRSPVHGGTIQLTVDREIRDRIQPEIELFVLEEKLLGLHTPRPYLEFARRIDTIRSHLVALVSKLRRSQAKVAGYGASAKGNVVLNYCGLGHDMIDFIVDSIPAKQGKFTPGTHIPIYSEEKLTPCSAQYALLLAWNYEEEILAKRADFRQQGGRFIKFVPSIQIL